MCGIVGSVGVFSKVKNTIEAIDALKYRGYDSAGISIGVKGKIVTFKSALARIGIEKIEEEINNYLKENNVKEEDTNISLAHTRWATHGAATVVNAHPHQFGKITLVHNGIVDNHEKLQDELIKEGYDLKENKNDSLVATVLLNHIYEDISKKNPKISVNEKMIISISELMNRIEGTYAFGIINEDSPEILYCTRKDSPLVVAKGTGENFISSDARAILKYTNKVVYLDDGDIAIVSGDKIAFYHDEKLIDKEFVICNAKALDNDKLGYDTFMEKEIMEEDKVIREVLASCFEENPKVAIVNLFSTGKMNGFDINKYNHIDIVACGSAAHAGYFAKCFLSKKAKVRINVHLASEYFQNDECLLLDNNSLVIYISQSGETIDTITCLKKTNKMGIDSLAIVNVLESSIDREAKYVLYTHAGNEVAVATTKAFIAQVALLGLLMTYLEKEKNVIDNEEFNKRIEEFKKSTLLLPVVVQKNMDMINKIADKYYNSEHMYLLGREIDASIAKEGSLKIKEVGRLHSESWEAGELKHGTITLIFKDTPVIAIITENTVARDTLNNVIEVKARGAKVIGLVSEELEYNTDIFDDVITIPQVDKYARNQVVMPLLQLLALRMTEKRISNGLLGDSKTDKSIIDKPANLAKSVTVK